MISTTDTLEPAPEDGAIGKRGQKVYPAGKFDPDIEYTCTEFVAPYVLDGPMYFAMNKVGISKGIDPSTDYATNGDNATWIPFDMFKYILTEVLFADFGKLASAIFLDDYMFSQHGKSGSGDIKEAADDYKNFNGDLSSSSNFIPNLLMNLLTGYLRCKNVDIEGRVIATDGVFKGSLSTPFVEYEFFDNEAIDLDQNSNIITESYMTNPLTLTLPTDIKWNGREISIFNKGLTSNSTAITIALNSSGGTYSLAKQAMATFKAIPGSTSVSWIKIY